MTVVTYTVVDLDVSTACWTEIADKLRLAGYDHVFSRGGKRIDMTNIALVSEEGEMAQIEKDHEQAILAENQLWCDPENDCWDECSRVAREIMTEKKDV